MNLAICTSYFNLSHSAEIEFFIVGLCKWSHNKGNKRKDMQNELAEYAFLRFCLGRTANSVAYRRTLATHLLKVSVLINCADRKHRSQAIRPHVPPNLHAHLNNGIDASAGVYASMVSGDVVVVVLMVCKLACISTNRYPGLAVYDLITKDVEKHESKQKRTF